MVLTVLGAAYDALVPKQYVYHICGGLLALYVIRILAQGRMTSRDRDLHARVILMTGAFTPLGLTLMESLAARGAHIIALTPEPIATSSPNTTPTNPPASDPPSNTPATSSENDPAIPPPHLSRTALLIDAIRSASNNPNIYAEHCDIESPAHIRTFCTRFLTGNDTRLDSIIFAHEGPHIGKVIGARKSSEVADEKHRSARSLATFLLTTLLLPALLVAPSERDIRILHVVNPFYAAGAGVAKKRDKGRGLKLACNFPGVLNVESDGKSAVAGLLPREGARALRTIVYTRHLQRILDALPSAQVPKTDAEAAGGAAAASVPVVSQKDQRSNITAVTVSPGISRLTTVAPMLGVGDSDRWSLRAFIIYILLNPFLRLFVKGPTAAAQSALHALFVPTAFKVVGGGVEKDKEEPGGAGKPIRTRQEVLKPGALYAECAVVPLAVDVPEEWLEDDKKDEEKSKSADKGKGKGTDKGKSTATEETLTLSDDGEYGGERAGRAVWEAFEAALKVWEASEEKKPEGEKKPTGGAAASSA
ncbi:hypothetical protein BD626DRAFT_544786 [Schizophyllum amplum]|uniref:Ketoreductase (KR) domain-containing protein n=1 Tax=Schizophyllum amplum TaxID=97359 RepID=A0A550D062_9AGAR|nr:hypothetical protein BD626DRAFT_544786 [Auriculariopsis ampla]